MTTARDVVSAVIRRRPALHRLAVRYFSRSVEQRTFVACIERGDTVYDVGANEGHFTILFSHLVGRRGAVRAFEPAPPALVKLRRRVAREITWDNVRVEATALADFVGVTELVMPGSDDGQASLHVHHVGSWAQAATRHSFPVQVTTLDDYVAREGIPQRVDFIKCDAEGAELSILRGARDLLASMRPALYLEFFGEWMSDFGYSATDLLNFLRAAGYDSLHLVEASGIRALEGAGPTLVGPANLLCFDRSRHGSTLASLRRILGQSC